jgi:endonuclease-3
MEQSAPKTTRKLARVSSTKSAAKSMAAGKHKASAKPSAKITPTAKAKPNSKAKPKDEAKPKPKGSGRRNSVATAREQLARLAAALPEPRCELDHGNAWQLLIATILSAQSTDARVNMVTPVLFRRYPTPAALGAAELPEVEQLIHSTGFFRNKAKAIVATSRAIAERHGGEVPRSLEALLELQGVARKTANVVLGTAYRLPTGIVVDTHAGRVARRLGITSEEDPAKVERDLCAIVAETDWVDTGHRLVLHGRYVCRAQQPDCGCCPLQELCPSAEHVALGSVAERAERERARITAARPTV